MALRDVFNWGGHTGEMVSTVVTTTGTGADGPLGTIAALDAMMTQQMRNIPAGFGQTVTIPTFATFEQRMQRIQDRVDQVAGTKTVPMGPDPAPAFAIEPTPQPIEVELADAEREEY